MPDEIDAPSGQLSRVVIQGTSGSGKTTLSLALAGALGVQCLELDGLYQQADWTPLEVDEFRSRVACFVDQPRWVVDGNYSHVRDILWPLATSIVFIDLPKRVVMTRVIKRTLLRIVKREQLWNGNRESWRNALSRDPMRNIILWSWNSHEKYREIVPREAAESVGLDRVVVLTSARDVRRFLNEARATR
jgi:adenylate kinase family enzyme